MVVKLKHFPAHFGMVVKLIDTHLFVTKNHLVWLLNLLTSIGLSAKVKPTPIYVTKLFICHKFETGMKKNFF